jgi:hypothetical protein
MATQHALPLVSRRPPPRGDKPDTLEPLEPLELTLGPLMTTESFCHHFRERCIVLS